MGHWVRAPGPRREIGAGGGKVMRSQEARDTGIVRISRVGAELVGGTGCTTGAGMWEALSDRGSGWKRERGRSGTMVEVTGWIAGSPKMGESSSTPK